LPLSLDSARHHPNIVIGRRTLKKTFKILAIVLGSVVALLIVGAVVVSLTFDPNKYKDDIIKLVKQQTGRDLKINGKISLSFFPWIGAELPALELSNAPGFDKKPFAEVKQAGIAVKLLPLLRKQVVVKQVTLDGLRLRLAKNRAGATNWDDMTGAKPAAKPAETKDGAPSALGGVAIGGVRMRDAEVTWDDQASGSAYSVRHLELKTGQLASGAPADIRLDFDIESAKPRINTHVKLDARLAIDTQKQTLDLPRLTLTLADMQLTLTDVKGSKILDAPAFSGKLDIASFNPRTLMTQLGIKLETADAKALSKASVSSVFDASARDLRLKNLKIVLDDTTITGNFALNDFAKPAYRFDINIDDIDADRYMPPAPPKPTDNKAARPAPVAVAPVVIPLDLLRSLNVDGGLKINKLKATGVRSNDVSTRLTAKDGVINLGPSAAKLYSGSYHGNMGIDARGKVLALSMNEKVSGVQIGPMLKDMQIFDNFSGTGDISLAVTARGLDARQITETLNGRLAFAARDGAIQGLDVLKMIDQAQALRDQYNGKPVEVKAAKDDKTAFKVISGSAVITNGVAQNNDLVIESPSMRATGLGNADLSKEKLDYHLNVTRNKDEGKKCSIWPLLIRGPFAKLRPALDFEAMIKCEGKAAVEKKVDEKKEELKEKLLDGLFKRKK
jgi:AsmA protein